MSAEHYQLLRVAEHASIDEIKKAYRARAKELHPDRNPSPEAQEQFVALTEAYEYILAERSGKYKQYVSPFGQAEQAANLRRAEAKRKARAYAQMRYEEFEQSEAGQTINALNVLVDHFLFVFIAFILIAIPAMLISSFGFTGIILSGFYVLALGKPIWTFGKRLFNFRDLKEAIFTLLQTHLIRIIILTAANVFVMVKIGLNTFLPIWSIPLILLCIALLWLLLNPMKQAGIEHTFTAWCLAPFVVSVLFAFNFYLSRNPQIEIYAFTNVQDNRRTTLIELEDLAYADYAGIRLFPSLEPMFGHTRVAYQVEDGLLGIRVVKDYQFIP